MSPFYLKEGEGSRRWMGEPKDIRGKDGKSFGVSILNVVKDPEQIRVSVEPNGNSYVIGERGDVIFPGKDAILNRDGFRVVDASTRKTLAEVTHRKK